jgi:TonB family protein
MRNLLLCSTLAFTLLGGALVHATPPSATSLSAYIGDVSSTIRSRLFYPPAARARGAKGVVGVSFSIGPSGAVSSFAITRSSGDSNLDAAARSLVQGSRFPPPPGGSARISTSFAYIPNLAPNAVAQAPLKPTNPTPVQPDPNTDPIAAQREAMMSLGMSVEDSVLGRAKDPVAEARAFAAIADAGERMDKTIQAGDVGSFVAAKRNFDALEDAELAREEASETTEEQAQIATALEDMKAKIHQWSAGQSAKDTPEQAAQLAEEVRKGQEFEREWDEKVAKWKAAHNFESEVARKPDVNAVWGRRPENTDEYRRWAMGCDRRPMPRVCQESPAAEAQNPSFNCTMARAPDEIVICRTPQLAELDNLVAAGYAFLKSKKGRQSADEVGIPFWRLRQACLSDPDCIRRRQFEAITANQAAGAPVSVPHWARPEGASPEPVAAPITGSQPAHPKVGEAACLYNANICEHGIGHVTGTNGKTYDVHVGDHITTPAGSNGVVIEANSTWVRVRSDADPEHIFTFYPTVADANRVSAQENISTAILFARTDALQLATHAMSSAMSAGATGPQAVDEGAKEGIALEETLIGWSNDDNSEDWKIVPGEYKQAVEFLRKNPIAATRLVESRDQYWTQWKQRSSTLR